MRKTSTTSTVRRRVGMAAIGAAAIAAVAVPGAAWANDDAATQDHSTTVDAGENADFEPARPAGAVDVDPAEFQQMIADGQFVPPTGNSVATIDKDGNVEVREVSAAELERMQAEGAFAPATPLR